MPAREDEDADDVAVESDFLCAAMVSVTFFIVHITWNWPCDVVMAHN